MREPLATAAPASALTTINQSDQYGSVYNSGDYGKTGDVYQGTGTFVSGHFSKSTSRNTDVSLVNKSGAGTTASTYLGFVPGNVQLCHARTLQPMACDSWRY